MTDTTSEILQKQIEIFQSKSESARFRIGDDLNIFGREVLESSIRQDHPGINAVDLKVEVFRRCYHEFFSQEELSRIIISMRDYLERL
jgi:hypothetical protein